MKYNRNKILIFSFDDGVTQDVRLIEIMNRYGIKGTFNINSELLGEKNELVCEGVRVSHNKVKPEDVRIIYSGHEIAGHTLTHPRLPAIEDDAEIIRQVEEDRRKLSELAGYAVTSFAYPCGGVNNDERVAGLVERFTGIKNARTITSSHSFALPKNIYRLDPTVYFHRETELAFELASRFIEAEATEPMLLYVWGHSYEQDIRNTWDKFEEFCKLLGGREDICYTTASALNQDKE